MNCNYCGEKAEKVTGKRIYPAIKKLHSKLFFLCEPCNAYVGTHPDGSPLGSLACPETRKFRMMAHYYFDKIWKERHFNRTDAYAWLASSLGIPFDRCHIGMFDITNCQKVIDICKKGFDP